MSAVWNEVASERRAHARSEVLQEARLKTTSGIELACEIRDYCAGGLFLRFDPSGQGAAVAAGLKRGETLEIRFAPPSIASPNCRLLARLARHCPDGIGVAFVGTPAEEIRVLDEIAGARVATTRLGTHLPGADGKALRESCERLLHRAFQGASNEFYGRIESRIAEVAAGEDDAEVQQELAAAGARIRAQEEAVRQVQHQHLQSAYDHYFDKRLDAGGGDDQDPGGFWLALSSEINKLAHYRDDEFEDWLNLTQAINRVEDDFRDPLSDLEPRLEKLYGRASERISNPFGPWVIAQALKVGIDSLALSLQARHVVYDTLGESLVRPLAELYQQLAGILPQVERPLELVSSRTPPAWLAQSSSATAGGIAGNLLQMLRSARQPQGRERASPGPGIGARELPERAASPASGENMAANFAASQRLLADLVAHGRIQPARLGEAQGAADVFGALAGTITQEALLPGSVKQVVGQLEEPLLKLAVLDPGFLDSAQHPAHRLLNTVDRLAMVSSDDGLISDPKLLDALQGWVRRIREESERNPGIYDEARAHLENLLQPLVRARSMRIARTQAGLEGWQKMGQANREITRQMQERIEGRTVPDLVMEFFNPGWRNYLIRVVMRQGAGSAEEAEAWQAVDRLLEWTDPERAEAPSFQEVQQLLTYIDSKLTLVSAGKDIQERLLERLADALSHPEQGRLRLLSNVKAGASEQQTEPVLDDADAALVGQFRVGDWFSLAGAATPLNLIWIGDDPPVYVFSNYQGVRKLELRRHQLLERLKAGETKRVDSLDLPLMDRSFSAMIEHVHRSLVRQATSDPETGLAQRPEFLRRVRHATQHPQGATAGCAMVVVDIEDLRLVQGRIDRDGYPQLLKALALHLTQCAGDFVGRTGERTFAVTKPCQNEDMALESGEACVTLINQFGFEWEGVRYTLTANAGVAWASAYVEPEHLYNRADAACLAAKHEGHNRVVIHRDEAGGRVGLVHWGERFNRALENGRLYLRCQPIVSLAAGAGEAAHYEILLGADDGEEGQFPIGEFVAALERLKRASELDQWVVREVFDWIRSHPQAFEKVGAFAVNLSGQSVNSRAFLGFMEEQLGRGDIPCHKLIFEITESAAIDSLANAERFIKRFRRYGCRFALDDFGVGFSSFSYLKNLKVDYLKIDGSFVRDMRRNEVDVAMISSMHETSRFLGIKTIAEWVEDDETLALLKTIGVNYVQGHLTGRPLPLAELTA